MFILFFYRNAARIEFPDVSVYGCNFHFAQATLKKRGEKGLKKEYFMFDKIREVFDLIDALAFLPVNQVMDGKCVSFVVEF